MARLPLLTFFAVQFLIVAGSLAGIVTMFVLSDQRSTDSAVTTLVENHLESTRVKLADEFNQHLLPMRQWAGRLRYTSPPPSTVCSDTIRYEDGGKTLENTIIESMWPSINESTVTWTYQVHRSEVRHPKLDDYYWGGCGCASSWCFHVWQGNISFFDRPAPPMNRSSIVERIDPASLYWDYNTDDPTTVARVSALREDVDFGGRWSHMYLFEDPTTKQIDTLVTLMVPFRFDADGKATNVVMMEVNVKALTDRFKKEYLSTEDSTIALFELATESLIAWNLDANATSKVEGNQKSFKMKETSDSLINSAVTEILKDCDLTSNCTLVTRFGDYVLSAVRVTGPAHLNLLFLQLTPRKHYYAEGEQARVLGIIISVVVGIVMISTGLIIYVAVAPALKTLQRNMQLAAVMRNDQVKPKRSIITEVDLMAEAFDNMNGRLVSLRSFVPPSLFGGMNGGPGDSMDTYLSSTTGKDSTDSAGIDFPNPMERSQDDEFDSPSRPPTRKFNVGVNANKLHQEKNSFLVRSSSVLSLSLLFGTKAANISGTTLNRIMVAFASVIAEHGGIIETLSLQRCVATFNAHVPCYSHQQKATIAALQLEVQLRECQSDMMEGNRDHFSFSVVVDSARNAVGTIGTNNYSARVVVGDAVAEVSKLHDVVEGYLPIGTHIIVTGRCKQQLGTTRLSGGTELRLLAVDVVSSIDGEPLFLFCPVVEQPDNPLFDSDFFSDFRDAVLCSQTNVMEAKKKIEALDSKYDTHSTVLHHLQRLRANCNFVESDGGNNYARKPTRSWAAMGNTERTGADILREELSRLSADKSQSDTAPPTLENAKVNVRDIVNTEITKRQNDIVEVTTGLFPLLTSENIDSTLNTGDKVHELPTEITDVHGTLWTRWGDAIGMGAFGSVYRALSPLGAPAAIKALGLSSFSDTEQLLAEMETASALHHDNIVCYYSSCVLRHHFVIVMEYVSGGTLQGMLRDFRGLPAGILKKYLRDVLLGLGYLHRQGFTHADLKPENVLISNDGICKIADFGRALSAPLSKTEYGDLRGTPRYMAPEVARGDSPSSASDIYSFGIMVAILTTGVHPWQYTYNGVGGGRTEMEFVERLGKDPSFRPQITMIQGSKIDVPQEVVQIFTKCTQREPSKRPTCDELISCSYFI